MLSVRARGWSIHSSCQEVCPAGQHQRTVSFIQPLLLPPPLFFTTTYPPLPPTPTSSLCHSPHHYSVYKLSQMTPNANNFTHNAPQHSSSRPFELKSITPRLKIWINSNDSKFILTLGFLNKSWLLFTKINPDQFDNFHWIWVLLYQPKRATQSLWAISIPMHLVVASHITGSTCSSASCTPTYPPMFYSSSWTNVMMNSPTL